MTMIMKVPQKQLLKLFDKIFDKTALKEKGYCTYIPIGVSHITINNVDYHFGDDGYHWYLSYNHYGQMAVEYTTEKPLDTPSNRTKGQCPLNKILFDLKNLTDIKFHAPSDIHDINPKTDDYYYDLFVFDLL